MGTLSITQILNADETVSNSITIVDQNGTYIHPAFLSAYVENNILFIISKLSNCRTYILTENDLPTLFVNGDTSDTLQDAAVAINNMMKI